MVYTRSIVILTDEPIFSFGLQVQFRNWGFTSIDMVETCQIAIGSIRKQMPALLILDEKFTEGQSLCSNLILLIERQSIPIILLTTYLDRIGINNEPGEKNKNHIYLSKPCKIIDLKGAVETLLHIDKLSA